MEKNDIETLTSIKNSLETSTKSDAVVIENPAVEVEKSLVSFLKHRLTKLQEVTTFEDQIKNAVNELSQEDLDSEIAEETLLEIATNELDSLDSLNSRDLKMAFGEEVSELEELEEEPQELEKDPIVDTIEDSTEDLDETEVPSDVEVPADNEGVEALKNQNNQRITGK